MAHKQPSQEELAAQVDAAMKAVETPEPEVPGTPDTPEPEKKPVEPETPEQKPEDKKPEETPEPDEAAELRKKVANSTRENQIIYAQNKKMAEAFDKATEVVEPTEDELKTLYPTWEELTDFERQMAKDKVLNDRRFAAIKDASKDFKDLEEWQGKVDTFVTDPIELQKHPLLEGKEAEFKLFAMKPTRRGVDFADLVSAFLYSEGASKSKNKGKKMFESGSGGDKTPSKPVSEKISVAESNRLRLTNYSKYKELLLAGKIEEGLPD